MKALERDQELEKSAKEGKEKTRRIVEEILEKIKTKQEVTRKNVLNYLEENYNERDNEDCKMWIIILFDENMKEKDKEAIKVAKRMIERLKSEKQEVKKEKVLKCLEEDGARRDVWYRIDTLFDENMEERIKKEEPCL